MDAAADLRSRLPQDAAKQARGGAQQLFNLPGIRKKMENIDGFFLGMPEFMKLMDFVAGVHPIVKGMPPTLCIYQ